MLSLGGGTQSTFPPHSRGWTIASASRAWDRTVSPALAGMDRPLRRCRRRHRRFPRTRGDGPKYRQAARPVRWFPPHSRGWTRRRGGFGSWDSVSPALAGMDPSRSTWSSVRFGFPRTRGDGPPPVAAVMAGTRFPPHSRGWTRPNRSASRSPVVSPALAGMDPCSTRERRPRRCFPRTRGDGPTPISRSGCAKPFPPHSRGWTDARKRDQQGADVSPALAGMDPS